MKVYKDKQQSLMLKPFGMAGRQYCGVTVFTYFDLGDPHSLLKEQQMWKDVPEQLGTGGALDMGMPKPRAEFLIHGSCHAPQGCRCRASKVSARVAELRKTLYVFGPRYWTQYGSITDPQPFSAVPLVYANAFGGPDYERNPLGRGYKTLEKTESGKEVSPLPLVEDPKQLIGSMGYYPEPAGFGPLDMMWPQRAAKTGTFGDVWLKTRWPDMPDDMDPTFYNTAPDNQQQPGWYAGDEAIELVNMHPELPLVQSRLPGKRIRIFLTMFKDYDRFRKPDEMETEFVEVPLHIDTVTLFPGILRGVVHYRGSVQSMDDEYHDILRAFVAAEEMGDAPKDIEHYRDEQLRRLDRGVKIDMAPFEQAGKKLSKLALKMRKLPREVERIGQKALGQAPFMPRSAEELAQLSKGNMAAGMATLDQLENVAKNLHARFGHKAHIDLKRFDTMRRKLKAMDEKLGQGANSIAAAKKRILSEKQALLAEAQETTKDTYDPEVLQAFGVTPEMAQKAKVPVGGFTLPTKNRGPFHENGFPLVVEARKRLEEDAEARSRLRKMGFDRETVANAWLGILPEAREHRLSVWRTLPGEQPQQIPEEDAFTIPAGLVMPRFDGRRLRRIMVRTNIPEHWPAPAEEALVPDSEEEPLALFPVAQEAHWVCVGDELQALYAEQELGDACGVVALNAPTLKPDKQALAEIEKAGVFLCIMAAGTSEDSTAWQPWRQQYPNARLLALPEGRTVFEAAMAGHELRTLVMDALPKDFAALHDIGFDLPDASGKGAVGIPKVAFPDMDLGGKIDELHKQGEARFAPMVKKLTAQREAGMASLKNMLAEAGDASTPEQAAAQAEGASKELADELNKVIANRKDFLQSKGYLSDEQSGALDDAQAQFSSLGERMDAVEAQGEAMFSKLDKQVAEVRQMAQANVIPGMSLEAMQAKGLDPQRLAPLTRERVIEMLEQGESLAGRDYSNLDLSELDFSDTDLRKALFIKTKLTKARLDRTRLDKAIVREADLSEASCKGASMRLVLFQGCKFKKASLADAALNKVSVVDSDLSEADLSGASLRLSTFQKCVMNKTNLANAAMRLSTFDRTDLSDAVLARTRMDKGLLMDATLDKADFSSATLHRVMLKRVTGKNVCFAGADMSHSRMTGYNELAGADFRNARLDSSCLRQANLSGANFAGASLKNALLEFCDLSNATLRLVPAKRARLLKTNLESADMAGMDLLMGSLRKSRLVKTDLTAANLYCVDFFKSVMHKTVLDRANLKRTLLYKREDLLP